MNAQDGILRELQAREALRALIGRYSRVADNRDATGLEALFHPDGLVDSGVIRAKPSVFAAQFVAWLEQNTVSVFHAICDAQFDLAEDEATGDIQVLALCQMNHAHGGKRIITAGRYADKYVVHDGRWVFSERIFKPDMSWECGASVEHSA